MLIIIFYCKKWITLCWRQAPVVFKQLISTDTVLNNVFIWALSHKLMLRQCMDITKHKHKKTLSQIKKTRKLMWIIKLVLVEGATKSANARKHRASSPCWFNVGPVSQTMGHHWATTGSTSRVRLSILMFTVKKQKTQTNVVFKQLISVDTGP